MIVGATRSRLSVAVGYLSLLHSGCTHIPHLEDPNVPDGAPIERVRLEGAQHIDPSTLEAGLANRGPEFNVLSFEYGVFSRRYFRFDDLQVELDRKRIESFYERSGYFGVTVGNPQIQPIEGTEDRLEIVWPVTEGKPTRVQDIVLEGAPPDQEAYLRTLLPIEAGDIYQSHAFNTAQTKLRAALVQRGYARAQVKGRVQIDRNASEARILLSVQPGPVMYLGELRAEGMVRTPTTAVLVRQTWAKGAQFSPGTLEQLRGRLYSLDQYDGIRLDYANNSPAKDPSPPPAEPSAGPSTPGESPVRPPLTAPDSERATTDIVARVEESERNELQVGVGGGFDPVNLYLRARARYKRRSFPFQLSNFTVEITPALQFLRTSDTFGTPELTPEGRVSVMWYDFPLPLFQLETDAGFQYQQLEAYEWFGPDVGQTLSKAIVNDRLKAALGWRFHQFGYEDQRVRGPDDPAIPGEPTEPSAQEILNIAGDTSVSVIILQPSLTFDGRDDALEPTRGLFVRGALDLGFATGDNASGFALVRPEIRGYVPVGSRLVLAARANLAANLDGTLPAPLRVFAGGASSQRGFPQRRLSPLRTLLDGESRLPQLDDQQLPIQIPIGGETVVEVSVEARLRLFRLFGYWFGLAGFIDGADLGDRLSDIQFPELHYAAGGGLRYLTPIGAIRLDYGYRLNRRSGADGDIACSGAFDCGTFHFSLGQAF